MVSFPNKTSRAVALRWVQFQLPSAFLKEVYPHVSRYLTHNEKYPGESLFSCWYGAMKPLQLHWLNMQNSIFLSVHSRYFMHYKTPMEQMHERCESYPPCDYLSDQIGFFMAYNHFFGRY